MERYTTPPTVGTLATLRIGSDTYAGTIVAVSKGGNVITFEFSDRIRDRVRATLRKDGTYRMVGSKRGTAITLGVARDYRDPHF
jgi:hypothetical protein